MRHNIFIDGTWNVPKDKSNVYKLWEELGGDYHSGPGTKALWGDTPTFSKWFGGAFGFGTQTIVDKAFDNLMSGSEPSKINIFGFSRGAAAARMLAGQLSAINWEVNFLGCFDTVGGFGIPFDILGIPFQSINLFSDMKIHPNVFRASHAMAAGEKRHTFKNTGMELRAGVTQRHFKGDHWEIGSGDATYQWMLDQFNNNIDQ